MIPGCPSPHGGYSSRSPGGMSQNYGGGYGGGGPPPQALMERRAAAGVTGGPPGPGSGMMGPAPPGFGQGYNPGGAGNTMGGAPQQSGNMGMMSAGCSKHAEPWATTVPGQQVNPCVLVPRDLAVPVLRENGSALT
ncbi:hypothetical protein HPB50_006094 [Hyalomma asiaticum]|uniref:Uncharacterized protein n=1 Tax=Hyalomma asiaticum TaxID=266040 RepID=A0ACB7SXX9_HYAAI|nr:hypothetical protein HPB50_006094 [Hyalomma asiaticum]